MAYETSMDGTWSVQFNQVVEFGSVEGNDQIIADMLKNGHQTLINYQNILVPDVYSAEINKFDEDSATTTAESNDKDEGGEHEEETSSFEARNGFTAEQNACQVEALKLHNSLRARHGVAELVLDDAINRKAQAYAQYLANSGQFQHSSDRDNLGENLYSAWSSAATERTGFGTQATQSWYDEIKDYDFNRPGFSMSTGHFTQVIWKSSNKLGVGIAFADGGRKVVVVAQYGPAGNMMGSFPQNVPPPH